MRIEGDLDGGEVVIVSFVVSGRDRAEAFEFSEEPLYRVAFPFR